MESCVRGPGNAQLGADGRHPDRIALAREFGATDVVTERGEEGVKRVRELAGGEGVHSVVECVGHGEAMETAVGTARPGGAVGRVGVPHHTEMPGSLPTFLGDVTIGGGPAPVRAYLDELLPEVLEGRIDPGRVFDHTVDRRRRDRPRRGAGGRRTGLRHDRDRVRRRRRHCRVARRWPDERARSPMAGDHTEENDDMNITLSVDDIELTTALIDSETTRDFLALLPLTLTLSDYRATEKISDLPRRLTITGAPEGHEPEMGDITYYAPWGNLAIFYDDFGYSPGLVKLGRIEAGIEALAASGGEVTVTLSRSTP